MDVFVYGTLRDTAIREVVIGHAVPRVTPSLIRGYQARLVRGGDFPMIRPSPDGVVEGLILHDLSQEDIDALDKFEGDTYSLEVMMAVLPDGREQAVRVYVDSGVYEDGGPFELERWARELRQGFIETFMGGRGFGRPAD
ncbi:gamma-glutamylcyclotransferase family protein [Alphaproteobacteria bacterium LSUCC0684]